MDVREYDYNFKIVVIGNSGVGKTCLNHRVSDNTFGVTYLSNIGVDFGIMKFVIDDERVRLQLWDTAGQERFRTITQSYFRGADGIIIAYDITNKESFDDIEVWLKTIDDAVTNPCKLLVGTKCDLTVPRQFESHIGSYEEQLPHQFQQRAPSSAHRLLQVGDDADSTTPLKDMREVSFPSAVECAKKHQLIGPIETSAKESINVELAYVTLVAAIVHKSKQSKKQLIEEKEPIVTQESTRNSLGCSTM